MQSKELYQKPFLNDTEDWIDTEKLRSFQNNFALSSGTVIFAMDDAGNKMFEPSGDPADVEAFTNCCDEEIYMAVYDRVNGHSIEEQVIEDTYISALKIAALSIRIKGRTRMTWIVAGILSEDPKGMEEATRLGFRHALSENDFYHTIDSLQIISTILAESSLKAETEKERSKRLASSEQEMGFTLKKNEAMTAVVQLLDRDDSIDDIMKEFLRITGEYLSVNSAHFFQLQRDNDQMDVVSEWYNSLDAISAQQLQNMPHYLRTEKVIVISHDTIMSSSEREMLRSMGLKALAIVPVVINGNISMYVTYEEVSRDLSWEVSDIRFISDAVKVFQSVMMRRIAKNSLASSYASLEAVLENVGCGIYVRAMTDNSVLFANHGMKQMFSREMASGILDSLIDEVKENNEGSAPWEMFVKSRGRWYDLYETEIDWVDGRKTQLFSFYDITDKKEYQKKIEQQAYTDYLTGMFNRQCCERDLAKMIDRAVNEHTSGGLFYLDLDDFKHINDGLGHQYGDILLQSISRGLRSVHGIEDTCYRMGGDEFVIIIAPEYYPTYEHIISDIRNIFSKPWFLKDADYYCTMSMGVVEFPAEGRDVQELIKKADIAMYEAKKSGKNRWMRYSQKDSPNSSRRLDMEKNLRDAIANDFNEFEVYYQPIIDIQKEGRPCTGAEALIRWHSSMLGELSPSEFIPLTEYLSLIVPLGRFVLTEACKTCVEWNQNGHPDYKINVNLSIIQLLQPDIVDIVREVLADTGIRPHNLTLEVTEGLAINDMNKMKNILSKIRALGVRIALDDFGTGYSSLNHIREMPLDIIKVDQNFTKELALNDFSKAVIRTIGDLADTIQVDLCVEGVESEEQLKIIQNMKVGLIQGFYFGKPMTKEEFNKQYV